MMTRTVTICIAKLEKFMAIWDQRAARIADRVAVLADGVVQRHGTIAELVGDEAAGLTAGLHRTLAEIVSC